MQKSILISILSIFFFSLHINAQSIDTLGTAYYLELAGKGFASGNVDFAIGPNSRMTIGLTLLDHEFAKRNQTDDEYPAMTLPTPSVMCFLLSGNNGHFMELGIGCSISPVPWKAYSPNDSWLTLHGNIGYRYQKSDKVFSELVLLPSTALTGLFFLW